MFTASCLCGGVQLAIDAPITEVRVCHCTQCQKAQGSAFAAVAPVPAAAVRVLQGQALWAEYRASPLKKRVFCQRCGSPLFSARDDLPEVLRLRVGIVDQPLPAAVASHAFCDERALWCELPPGPPQFAGAVPDVPAAPSASVALGAPASPAAPQGV